MGSARRHLFLCALALVLAAASAGPVGAAPLAPPPVVLVRGALDFTPAHRTPAQIRLIVVHVSEGSFLGTLAWLRNPRARSSANYVVSRVGRIAELVPRRDIAWHAGNWAVNVESVGIEHVGITGDPAGFTAAEYRASARLAAYIARSSLIPIDREHIIGHDQVPDPTDPLLGGGIDNHTDPGRYWNWPRYMRLVRAFAFPEVRRAHPHVGLGVDSTTLYGGQTVAGRVPWRVRASGPVSHVSFLVDGRVRWIDHRPPFAFAGGRGLATLPLANGRHRLELRAYGPRGAWTRDRFAVRIRNVHFSVAASGLRPGQAVAGTVPVSVLADGAVPRRAALLLDGREIDHDTSKPLLFRWDTTRVRDGRHVVELRVRARGGYLASARVPVVVANDAPAVSLVSPAEGQAVSGPVPVAAETRGKVVRVRVLVDGQEVATLASPPWSWTWTPAGLSPGSHVLTVRAEAQDGTAAVASCEVEVGAAP